MKKTIFLSTGIILASTGVIAKTSINCANEINSSNINFNINIKDEIDIKTKELNDLEIQLKNKEKELEILLNDHNLTNTDITNLKNKILNLKITIYQINEKIIEKKNKLEENKKTIENNNTKINLLKEEILNLGNTNLENIQEKIDQLKIQINDLVLTNKKLQEENDLNEKEISNKKEELDKNNALISAKQKEIDKIKTNLETIQTNINSKELEKQTIENDLIIAKENYNAAKNEYGAIKNQENQNLSSKTFFEYLGDTNAANLVNPQGKNNDVYKGTQLGASGDATSLENMQATITQLKELNELRKVNNLPELKITNSAMAVSQLQCNRSFLNYKETHNMKHFNELVKTENLAMTYDNYPFSLWYTQEKAIFEEECAKNPDLKNLSAFEISQQYPNLYSKVGHYLNIIDPNLEVTGFAIAYQPNLRNQNKWYENCFGNKYNSLIAENQKQYTIEEYEQLLNNYINNTNNNSNASLESVQQKMEQYKVEVDQLTNKLNNINNEINILKNSKNNENIKINNLNNDINNLKTTNDSLNILVNDLQTSISTNYNNINNNDKINNLNKEINDLKTINKEEVIIQLIKDKKTSLNTLIDSNTRLEKDNQQLDHEIENLYYNLDYWQEKLINLQIINDPITKVQNEINDLSKKIEILKNEIYNLNNHLDNNSNYSETTSNTFTVTNNYKVTHNNIEKVTIEETTQPKEIQTGKISSIILLSSIAGISTFILYRHRK